MATIPASRRADLDRGFGRAVAFCRSTDLRTFVFWCAPVLGCLLSYGLCFYLFAQDAVFVANVKVVPLLATVRDRAGKVVNNLTKEDFVLEEDGRRRPIEYFSKQSDLALTIGLLVDTSKSQRRVLNAERRASDAFLSHVIREDRDTAFVAHFDIRVGILQGPTSSRERLSAALAGLKTPHLAGTRLYSGIWLASENLMRTQKGRKAFILLSDGVNYLDNTSIGTAIEYAQRADTIIYSIIYADHASARGTKVMQRLAGESGGRCFVVSPIDPIENIYSQIEEELRSQYGLGFTVDMTKPGAPIVSCGSQRPSAISLCRHATDISRTDSEVRQALCWAWFTRKVMCIIKSYPLLFWANV